MNEGWICPRCRKVHAPQVLGCDCAQETIITPGKIWSYPPPDYWFCPTCGQWHNTGHICIAYPQGTITSEENHTTGTLAR